MFQILSRDNLSLSNNPIQDTQINKHVWVPDNARTGKVKRIPSSAALE